MGYIAHNSIPDAMAPTANAWLPFITTRGVSGFSIGPSTRNSTFCSAH